MILSNWLPKLSSVEALSDKAKYFPVLHSRSQGHVAGLWGFSGLTIKIVYLNIQTLLPSLRNVPEMCGVLFDPTGQVPSGFGIGQGTQRDYWCPYKAG